MNKNNKIECIKCNSIDLEVLEGKNVQSGERVRVNDLWVKCRICKQESPVFADEIEIAKNMLMQQKRLK